MVTRTLQRGFGAGEITSSLFARSDLTQYAMGATKIENFVVLPQGAMRTRAGFRLVGQAVDSSHPVRLIPFRYSSEQTFVLEFGNYTLRIIENGSYLANSDNAIYQISTPYKAEDLKNIDCSQNADVLTLTNPDYSPYELRRYSNTDWRFIKVTVTPSVSAPTGLSYEARYASYMTDAESKTKDKIKPTYVVTTVDTENKESVASTPLEAKGNYYITGASIRVKWNAVKGADYYRVYREVAGIYCFVGETEKTYLDDVGNNPDSNTTPPKYKEIFSQKVAGQIKTISVVNGGSDYYYGSYNNIISLPRTLTVNAIPPVMSFADTTAESENITDFKVSAKLDVINITSGEVYSNSFNNSLNVKYEVVSYSEDDTTKYRKIAYIDEQDIQLTVDKLEVQNAVIKLNVTVTNGEVNYNYNFDKQAVANAFKDNQNFISSYTNGVSLPVFRTLFHQNDTTVQIKLSIKDNKGEGSGASAYAICVNGSISSVLLVNTGSEYSDNVSINVQSTVGSGASFTVSVSEGTTADNPSSVAQYDQRRVFGGSYNNPLKVWFTNAGYQDLMMYHLPTLDTDRIEITAVTSDADRIKHIVALDSLILMTGSSELRVFTQNSDALTPSSVAVRAQSFVGSNNVQPVIVNNLIVYVSQRGGHVRTLGYNYNQQGYVSTDISVRAPHLFDNKDVTSITLCKSPVQVVWAVSSDGKLLGCTFSPEQDQVAWHRHSTVNGKFESVCAISEGTEDHLYVVVNRNGTRYIERSDDFNANKSKEYYRCLDSYLDTTFSTNQSKVSGLNHLEGQEVAVYVDGVQQSNKIVKQGLIVLDKAGKNIAVGLPITASFISVPLTIANTEADLQDRTKNISEVNLRVSYEGDLYSANYPRGDEFKCQRLDEYQTVTGDESYLVKVAVNGEWSEQSQFSIKHKNAVPVEIQSVILNINYEDGK